MHRNAVCEKNKQRKWEVNKNYYYNLLISCNKCDDYLQITFKNKVYYLNLNEDLQSFPCVSFFFLLASFPSSQLDNIRL